jgi:archaellum component FlaC
MSDELKQFADLILKSMESMEERMNSRMDGMEQRLNVRMDTMEERINTELQGIKTDVQEIKSNISILMESTERAAVNLSNLDSKVKQREKLLVDYLKIVE